MTIDDLLHRLGTSSPAIEALCRRWKIHRLEVFGSVLRDDFDSRSDVDVLVTFMPDARWHLRDELRLEDELQALFNRPIDLVERELVEKSPNWVRRRRILESARELYAAA